MKPLLSCIPCIIKQIIYTGRAVSSDTWLQKQVVSRCIKELSEIDYSVLPVTLVNRIYQRAVDSLGVSDPFQNQKEELVDKFSSILAKIEEVASEIDNDRVTAVLKMSAAANHYPGFLDLESTFRDILETASGSELIFQRKRFEKEYSKSNKIILFPSGFLEFPFDVFLASLLGMEEITVAAPSKPLLWGITEKEISAIGDNMPFNFDMKTIVYNNIQKNLAEVANEEDLILCKGFINYQYFVGSKNVLWTLFYANRWCRPCMESLGMSNNSASGIVLKTIE